MVGAPPGHHKNLTGVSRVITLQPAVDDERRHEVHECEFARGTCAATSAGMPKTSHIDITNQLATVHGGRGAARAVGTVLRHGGQALEKVGSYFGGAMALKEGWDYLRGNNSGGQQQQPPQQPSPARPAAPTPSGE
jgi:hypothetical protein